MRVTTLHNLGLQMCAIGMLIALVAGGWGYLVEPSRMVFVLAALAGAISVVGIGLLGFTHFAKDTSARSE